MPQKHFLICFSLSIASPIQLSPLKISSVSECGMFRSFFPTCIAFIFAHVFPGHGSHVLRVRKLRFLLDLGFMAICSNNLYALFHKSDETFQYVQREELNFASLS